jgi:RNA polymerase sigma-70 factor (ECF subfamily)
MSDACAPTDEQLLQRGRSGDRDALEELVRRHRERVGRIASRYARDSAEADDLAQTAFVKALRALDRFSGRAPFEHWLARITVRTCYDALRARRRRPEVRFSDLTDDQQSWLERFEAGGADDAAAEAKELVRKVLETLPADARLVLTLLEIEERPAKEIAALTGWSVPLVKVRAFRARALMRRACERLMERKP